MVFFLIKVTNFVPFRPKWYCTCYQTGHYEMCKYPIGQCTTIEYLLSSLISLAFSHLFMTCPMVVLLQPKMKNLKNL